MARFLIDEDLPLTLCSTLLHQGHDCRHIIEMGQRGVSDARVFALAQELKATLVSRDTDFCNVLQYPLGSHCGIAVIRFPSETRSRVVVDAVARALATTKEAEFAGALMIIEPGQTRIRRAL